MFLILLYKAKPFLQHFLNTALIITRVYFSTRSTRKKWKRSKIYA